jgi:hypothetical protein
MREFSGDNQLFPAAKDAASAAACLCVIIFGLGCVKKSGGGDADNDSSPMFKIVLFYRLPSWMEEFQLRKKLLFEGHLS